MIGLKFKQSNRIYFKVEWQLNRSSILLISLLVLLDNIHGFDFENENNNESTLIPNFDSDNNSNGLLVGGSYEYYEDNNKATETFEDDLEDFIKTSVFSGPGGIIEDYVPVGNDGIPQMINRVIGGIPADDETFPYIISLRYSLLKYGHFCGGAILSPTWIITAAHCVKQNNTESYRVQLNYNNFKDQKDKQYGVQKILVPHRRGVYTDDIALLQLNESIPLGDKIFPVKLLSSPARPGQQVTVAGWGFVRHSTTARLLTAEFPLRNPSDCKMIFRKEFDDGMMCAGIKGVDACPGDSGGPLVIKGPTPRDDVIIGVVSWGPLCGTAYGVYTDIWYYREWIESNTDLDQPLNPLRFPWHSYKDKEPNRGRPGSFRSNKWRST